MRLSLRHWRAPHLLGAWAAYWIGLGALTIGRPIMLVRSLPKSEGDQNSFSLGFEDGGFEAVVKEGGRVIYDGSASLMTVVLAVAGPPLLLWLVWLLTRPRRDASMPAGGALGAGPMRDVDARDRMRERDRR